MAKKTFVSLLLLALVAVSGQAFAVVGANDTVPAATLLLPYFEVDLTNPNGVTTLFSVNNASAAPALAHVTIWTDMSVPILDFDIYLTGYDIHTINMRDIIADGILPQTGSAISNLGAFSIFGTFPGCNDTQAPGAPNYSPLPATVVGIIQDALTGVALRAGQAVGSCAGVPYGDGIARGYVTVDSVSACSTEFPSSPGYFIDGGQGTANNRNVLWGDYFFVDVANAFAQGESLVHIEADAITLSAIIPSCDITDYNPTTFYCRYTAVAGSDNREALPSMWGSRYLEGGAFSGGTDFIVWRNTNDEEDTFACGAFPPFFLLQDQIVIFDEQENPTTVQELPSGPFGAPEEFPFPWETQRVAVGEGFSVANPFGWTYLNLNTISSTAEFNQAWVTTILSASGLYSVGYDGLGLNNLNVGVGPSPLDSINDGTDDVCIGANGAAFSCS